MSAPQPGEAHSGPQLQGERALASRHVECLMKALLGSLERRRHSLQEKQLPFCAEQLREVPSRFGLLRARQRLVHHTQPLGNLSATAETRSELGKKQTHVVMHGGLGQSLERRLEQL